MSADLTRADGSPFDAVRRTRADGSEFWSARDLMPLLGYFAIRTREAETQLSALDLYTQIMGTDEFVWPVTNKVYGSRSTAEKRRKLLESYGATAVVEQSSRITWPEVES